MSLFSHLKSHLSVADVVGDYVTLRPAGHYLKGTCPFHSEKDASFTVSPDKGIFYCFGCHAGGDLIAFVANIENLSQIEAAHFLVERYNIEIPKSVQDEYSSFSSTSIDEKKRYTVVCGTIAQWCHRQLALSPQAVKYIASRTISDAIQKRFVIGYFPGGMRAINTFISDMAKQSILLKELLSVGVLVQGDRSVYSPFEKRIMFPIYDVHGDCYGFGGRVHVSTDERAKYYNSKESPYFQKGHVLFGLHHAKKLMRTKEYAFLVEGYTDCIAMAQYGYENTVATLGTACTADHLKTLSRYITALYILYDGDAAGKKAALRLLELCWNINLELKVLPLPLSHDPASYLESGGTIESLMEKARDIVTFFVDYESESFTKKPLSHKLAASRKIVGVIARLEDSFKQDVLLQQLARQTQLPFTSLKDLLGKARKPEKRLESDVFVSNKEPKDGLFSFDGDDLEKRIIFAIINGVSRGELLELDAEVVALFSPGGQALLGKLREVKGGSDIFGTFFERLNGEEQRWVSFHCLQDGEEISREHIDRLIFRFRKMKWRQLVDDLKQKMLEAQKREDQLALGEIMSEFASLKRDMKSRGLL